MAGALKEHGTKVILTLIHFKEKGSENVLLIGGGVILKDYILELKRLGWEEIFPPGTPTDEIVSFIRGCTLLGITTKE